MSKLVWDAIGEHIYETGTRNGVCYPQDSNGAYPAGVAWNGLTAVTESPEGAEPTDLWADDIKYLTLRSAETFGGTIEAYTYPDEFAQCDGSYSIATGVTTGQQPRKTFGLCYRTVVGNDTENDAYGYKLHLVYGATASPSEKSYQTINDSPEAITFSWEFTSTPISANIDGIPKPIYQITVDSTKATAAKLAALEAVLFGAEAFDATSTYAVGDVVEYTTNSKAEVYVCSTAISTAAAWDATKWTKVGDAGPRLPLPEEVASIFAA